MSAPDGRLAAALAAGVSGALIACSAFRALNRGLPEPEPGISFYSDLGPAALDVSSYPAAQRAGCKLAGPFQAQQDQLRRRYDALIEERARRPGR